MTFKAPLCRSSNCISIVVPTYNEAVNVKLLIPLLSKTLSSRGITHEIIVVDDDSPDGTAEVAKALSVEYPVKVIVRRGVRGLASAVIRGFKETSCSYVVVMDADLQHPPHVVPRIFSALLKGCDIVVASRYVKGGGVEGWSKLRLVESKIATLLAHMLIRESRRTTDPMSGFFGCRKEAVAVKGAARGFKILLEILHANPQAKVCDVPYLFRARLHGKSKLGLSTILDYLIQLVFRAFM